MKQFMVAAIVVVAGCSSMGTPGPADLPSQEFSGHLTTSSNGTFFIPCTSSSRTPIWLTFTGGSVETFERARTAGTIVPGQNVFVRLRAALTDERHVGPGGPALLVREMWDVHQATDADCARE